VLLNPESITAIQPELLSGERILWADQPNTTTIFHKEDGFLIPFSLFWGGFAIFWEFAAAGLLGNGPRSSPASSFPVLWGVPFVVVGQYLIWGRFLYAAWKKKRTYYGVTERRVVVVQNGWKRCMASAFLDTLPNLIKENGRNGSGTLRFAQPQPMWSGSGGWGVWDGMAIGTVPTFVDIDDVDGVYHLVSDLREKKPSPFLK
jgi:hypothetical protein